MTPVTVTAKANSFGTFPVTLNMPSLVRNPEDLLLAEGSDAVIILIEPDGFSAHEFYQWTWNNGAPSATGHRQWSAKNSDNALEGGVRTRYGVSASGLSCLFGLHRGHEYTEGLEIQHVIQLTLSHTSPDQFANQTVFPAGFTDSLCSISGNCNGAIPYGQRFGLPPSVVIDNLRTPSGALFNTLQKAFALAAYRYGWIPIDGLSGTANNSRADQYMTASQVTQITDAMITLKPLMAPILNGAEGQIAWGGGSALGANSAWDSSPPGGIPVTNYGILTPDNSSDAIKTQNTATIALACDTVGAAGGGILQIPAGTFYLTKRVSWIDNGSQWAGSPVCIAISYSNMTLQGAGKGITILKTESVFANHARAHGIIIPGKASGTPQSNVTVRDMDLDGGAGWTGCYDWQGDQPNCWDITHKGIIASADAKLDNLTLENLYVHAYRGEVLYSAGDNMWHMTVRNVKVEDSNGSCFNLWAANGLIENCEFGKSRFWIELTARPNTGGYPDNIMTFRNNSFHDNNADAGVSFGQGLDTAMHFVFDSNTFTATQNNMLFGIFGGVAGPVEITNNIISGVGSWVMYFAVHDAVANNGNILFSHNTITNAQGFASFQYENIHDVTLDNNDFSGTSVSNPAASESTPYGSGANLTRIVISNNTFRNCRVPRNTGAFTGTAPTFTNNTNINTVA